MRSGKLSVSLCLTAAFTAIVVLAFVTCNTARRASQMSSADMSIGQGSSGSIAHKTWTEYGGGADQSKYVDFKQINKNNVNRLEVAWSYSTKDNVASYRFNPLIVDNTMYVLAKNNSLVVRATAAYMQLCQSCHGANKGGGLGPSLVNINSRLNFENFQTVVNLGRAQMPSFLHIGEQNLVDLYKFLSNAQGRQGGRGGAFGQQQRGMEAPDGPVVASGGAPLPPQSQAPRSEEDLRNPIQKVPSFPGFAMLMGHRVPTDLDILPCWLRPGLP